MIERDSLHRGITGRKEKEVWLGGRSKCCKINVLLFLSWYEINAIEINLK